MVSSLLNQEWVLDLEDNSELYKIKEFRAFLKKALLLQYQNKINYSDFTRKCGFKSRSTIREIVEGKKGLSTESLHKILTHLNIDRNLKNYFKNLVYLEFPNLSNDKCSIEERKLKIDQIKNFFNNSNEKIDDLYSTKTLVYRIFAILGSNPKSLEEISLLLNTNEKIITKHLKDLMKTKLISYKDNLFQANLDKIDNENFSNEQTINLLVRNLCKEIPIIKENSNKNNNDFYYYAALSIDRCKQREMRNKIREAIFQILDEYQDDSQDHVQEIFISLFKR